MNSKIQWGVAGMILFAALLWRYMAAGDSEKKPEQKLIEAEKPAPDQVEKNKIMSELGKKGAAKSAAVRKAKKAQKAAAKEALLNEFSA